MLKVQVIRDGDLLELVYNTQTLVAITTVLEEQEDVLFADETETKLSEDVTVDRQAMEPLKLKEGDVVRRWKAPKKLDSVKETDVPI